MRSERSVTMWNVSALVAVVIGALLTLLADRLWLQRWVQSGQRVPIAQRATVELPAGRSLVFYESLVAVPTYSTARLHVFNRIDRGVEIEPTSENNEFALRSRDHSGRALWVIDVPESGEYEIICYNAGYKADHDVPHEDRVVFTKQPGTLSEAQFAQRLIRFGGGGLTVLLTMSLYVGHYRAIQSSRPGSPSLASRIVGEPLGPDDEFSLAERFDA